MKYVWIALAILAIPFAVLADNGMKTQASNHGFRETQGRLKATLKEKSLTVFAKVDHAEGARKAGLKMPPAMTSRGRTNWRRNSTVCWRRLPRLRRNKSFLEPGAAEAGIIDRAPCRVSRQLVMGFANGT